MDTLGEAICFATKAFDGQVRKCEKYPAILHSFEAATIAQTVTNETDVVVAAVLHDTVEDTDVTIEEIKEIFGERVAKLVASETENKRHEKPSDETWQIRKQEAITLLENTDDLGVKAIFLGDKLSNLRSLYRSKLKFGEELWNQFHQNDPEMHKWYYTSVLRCLKDFADSPAYNEYNELLNKIFGGN